MSDFEIITDADLCEDDEAFQVQLDKAKQAMDYHRLDLSRDPESGFWTVTSPTVPGLITGGRTIADTLRKAGLVIDAMKSVQTPDATPEAVDYRTLLKKHIRHVGECEGANFIDCGYSNVTFTDAEHLALKELEREDDAEA